MDNLNKEKIVGRLLLLEHIDAREAIELLAVKTEEGEDEIREYFKRGLETDEVESMQSFLKRTSEENQKKISKPQDEVGFDETDELLKKMSREFVDKANSVPTSGRKCIEEVERIIKTRLAEKIREDFGIDANLLTNELQEKIDSIVEKINAAMEKFSIDKDTLTGNTKCDDLISPSIYQPYIYVQPAYYNYAENCPCNTKNGGSGVCGCTLSGAKVNCSTNPSSCCSYTFTVNPIS